MAGISTDRQKSAVHFCEKGLNISFEGDINNKEKVSEFLSKYLDDAIYEEIAVNIKHIFGD